VKSRPRFPQEPHGDVETGGFEESDAVEYAKPASFPFAAIQQRFKVLVVKIGQERDEYRNRRFFWCKKSRADVDRLLDYCQALESIIPFTGKQIPEYAARVLEENARGLRGAQSDTLDFLKDMYKLRNSVMHGKFDQVVDDRAGTRYKLKDVDLFRRYVYDLAILYFLNPDPKGEPNLRRFIMHLRRGKAVELRTLADA